MKQTKSKRFKMMGSWWKQRIWLIQMFKFVGESHFGCIQHLHLQCLMLKLELTELARTQYHVSRYIRYKHLGKWRYKFGKLINFFFFQWQGAPLSEYTLRLVGSDIEHYIRKLLYDGEIKYNMNARVLNFSMGKPRVKFNN